MSPIHAANARSARVLSKYKDTQHYPNDMQIAAQFHRLGRRPGHIKYLGTVGKINTYQSPAAAMKKHQIADLQYQNYLDTLNKGVSSNQIPLKDSKSTTHLEHPSRRFNLPYYNGDPKGRLEYMFQDMEPRLNQGSGYKEVPVPLQWPNERVDYAKAFQELDRLRTEQFMYQQSPYNTNERIDPSKVLVTERFMEYELGIYADMSPYEKLKAMRSGGPIPLSAFDRMENSKVRAEMNVSPGSKLNKQFRTFEHEVVPHLPIQRSIKQIPSKQLQSANMARYVEGDLRFNEYIPLYKHR